MVVVEQMLLQAAHLGLIGLSNLVGHAQFGCDHGNYNGENVYFVEYTLRLQLT